MSGKSKLRQVVGTGVKRESCPVSGSQAQAVLGCDNGSPMMGVLAPRDDKPGVFRQFNSSVRRPATDLAGESTVEHWRGTRHTPPQSCAAAHAPHNPQQTGER